MTIYKPDAGGMISGHLQQAISLAHEKDDTVEFEFNGIPLTVTPGSSVRDMCIVYALKRELRYIKTNPGKSYWT